ncbi:MAG: TetR/AcrR family transcriptional regulator [Acidimicrobiales bacterium]|nr:TetR/AcrR family transcriptional regulator [Acidimicrobiales bacterium]
MSMGSKGAQTRETILRAAIARFARDGFRPTSVADIAREAGVSGTLVYAYFPNKEALFLAALDEDAADLIQIAVDHLQDFMDHSNDWRATLLLALVEAIEFHPLAKRILAGLEPDVTERVLEIPALEELRKLIAERIRGEQLDGRARSDIDPVVVGSGLVSIFLSLLMSVTQLGPDAIATYAPGVMSVMEAALLPSPK